MNNTKNNAIAFPGAQAPKRLTKRGKAVVAIAYVVGTVLAGIVLANCLLDGLEEEGRIRDAQSAPYIEALQHKKLQSLDR